MEDYNWGRLTVLLLFLCAIVMVGAAAPAAATEGQTPPPDGREVYDVIVVGGEPEGIAAAISAARNGLRTLLVDRRDGLGGLWTYGMLNVIDINYDHRGGLATRGIFSEFYRLVGGDAFNVGKARAAFQTLVAQQPGLTTMLNTRLVRPLFAEANPRNEPPGVRLLAGIEVEQNGQLRSFYARRFVDATQDADLAAASGVPYTIGEQDIGRPGRFMAATLILHIGGVDWNQVVGTARRHTFGYSKANSVEAWGFPLIGQRYKPHDPITRLRGLNIGRQGKDEVLINGLLIFGVNGLDPQSVENGMARGQAEAVYVLSYLKKNFPGFEHAYLLSFPPELYIRETRHIIGQSRLTLADVLENRDFPDRIGLGSYPVDVQATSANDYGAVYGAPDTYAIPFRVMVTPSVPNLLVVGRSASYTSLAAGSARTVPVGIVEGQAAGVAAMVSIQENVLFPDFIWHPSTVARMQALLIRQGAYLRPPDATNRNVGHWAYPAARTLLELGLVAGGYDNNLQFAEPATGLRFANIIVPGWIQSRRLALYRSEPVAEPVPVTPAERALVSQVYALATAGQITGEQAARMVLLLAGGRLAQDDSYALARQQGLLSPAYLAHCGPGPLDNACAYELAATFLRGLAPDLR